MKSARFVVLAGLAALVCGSLWVGRPAQGDDADKKAPLYELRTYYAHPGKMADLNKRFRDHTLKMFEKHGMKNVAYWTPVDKPEVLVYVIAHKSKQAADKSWQEFKDDPEWQAAYKESHKNGPLVMKVESVYMTATDYSPMK
jgi:hypothetical protein